MFAKRPLPWLDFVASLETGDVILMQGTAPPAVNEEMLLSSTWSHVGMAVRASDLSISVPDSCGVLFWESNQDPAVTDVILHEKKPGPVLAPIEERFTYDLAQHLVGKIATRKLHVTHRSQLIKPLSDTIAEVHSAGFDPVAETVLLSFILGRTANQPGTGKTFLCSELLSLTYQHMGLLTKQYVPNSYAPADYAEALDVSLLNGAWLGRETFLDLTTMPVPAKPPVP